jgi:hypothetical protein
MLRSPGTHPTLPVPTEIASRQRRRVPPARALALVLAFAAAAIAPGGRAAHADLTIKNLHSQTIWVAYAFEVTRPPDIPIGRFDPVCWISIYGWRKIEPGQTSTLRQGDLRNFSPNFYLYAQSADGLVWSGQGNEPWFWIDPVNRFTRCDANDQHGGDVRKQFRHRSVAGYAHYTFNIRSGTGG